MVFRYFKNNCTYLYRTWNDYLNDIKYFFRWLYNNKKENRERIKNVEMVSPDWETPLFAKIKKKKIQMFLMLTIYSIYQKLRFR